MRSKRHIARLALAEPSVVELVEAIVAQYRRASETQYRSAARLVLALHAVVDGDAAPEANPRLGAIADALAGRRDPVSIAMGVVPDRRLRNAEAHEDFYVDPETVAVILDGVAIDADELDTMLERLYGVVAAVEAAIMCHRIDEDLHFAVPAWVASGSQPDAVRIIISSLAAA